jgi:hypothetical protein
MNNQQFMQWALEVTNQEYAGNIKEFMRCN